MAGFPSEFSSKAGKCIRKLDPVTKKRIEDKIDKLEETLFHKKLKELKTLKARKFSE